MDQQERHPQLLHHGEPRLRADRRKEQRLQTLRHSGWAWEIRQTYSINSGQQNIKQVCNRQQEPRSLELAQQQLEDNAEHHRGHK